MMSGNSESVDDRLRRLDAALDAYESEIGLHKVKIHSEAEPYLNITQAQLSKLSDEQCGEAAVVVAQFGFHIQRSYNEEVARMNWAQSTAMRTIAEETANYQAPSYEE